MFQLLKNIHVYAPKNLGVVDVLLFHDKIAKIGNNLDTFKSVSEVHHLDGHIATPGFIDQHIHLIGAGGKDGFESMTPEIQMSELIACGTTTVVGLLGTDGNTRNIKSLYAKVKSLNQQGVSAYMYSGYYGLDPVTITNNIQCDMIFIDKVLGQKIAISDIRSSYPTALELVRILRDIRVGGLIANKKGILHIHLGNLDTKMDVLFELIERYQFPIEHISPTHVGRTKVLFDEAIRFAKLGGMIDITTGASKYDEPYKTVLYALDHGVSIDKMTFSSDGHAGLTVFDSNKNPIGLAKAPFDLNAAEVIKLIKLGGLPAEESLKLITKNPANNLGLKHKGAIDVLYDADINIFDESFQLTHVFAKGQLMMKYKEIIKKGPFE